MYPEFFIAPMRDELTRLGVIELRTADEVDSTLNKEGTVMVVVNSVCGCAAGRARPGVALALEHSIKPDTVATVFAGAPGLFGIGRSEVQLVLEELGLNTMARAEDLSADDWVRLTDTLAAAA